MKRLCNVFKNEKIYLVLPEGEFISEKLCNLIKKFSQKTGLRVIELAVKGTGNTLQSNEDFIVEKGNFDKLLDESVVISFLEKSLKILPTFLPEEILSREKVIDKTVIFSQKKINLYTFYIEHLKIIYGNENKIISEKFGFREIALNNLENGFIKNFIFSLKKGNLFYCKLEFNKMNVLSPIRVKFYKKHKPVEDPEWQKIIINAYWQTCWATGAIRGNRGTTEPVIFFPLPDRDKSILRKISDEKFITSQNFYYFYMLKTEVERENLYYNVENKKVFLKDKSLCPDFPFNFFNENCFIDLYFGSNARLKGNVTIKRAVAVNGSHLLTYIANDYLEDNAFTDKICPNNLIAATNSIFFLNFPEEYPAYYTAMNAPVGLLVINGEIIQPPIIKRSCFYQTKNGSFIDIFSIENLKITIGNMEICPQKTNKVGKYMCNDIFIYTSLYDLQSSIVKDDRMKLIVVGNKIVEITKEKEVYIPQNGFILSLSEKYEEFIFNLKTYECCYEITKNGESLEIINAFSAGPMLLYKGKCIDDNLFDEKLQFTDKISENFVPYVKDKLSGLVPTRFPHFVNKIRAPRTIIGIKENKILLIVIDGRSDEEHSIGMTLKEESLFLKELGCEDALNLDGGGSSIMWLKKGTDFKIYEDSKIDIVNRPSDLGGKERLLPVPIFLFSQIK